MRELEERLVGSEGYGLYMKVRALGRSYYIFDRNHRALVVILEKLVEEPGSLLPIFVQPTQESFYLLEANVAIVLHNFLAGAKTLVDHTRVLVRDLYGGSAFEDEYQKKVDERLKNSPVVQFVQRLRNYALHKSIPVTTTKLRIKRVGTEQNEVSLSGSITLNVDELRGWDGWSSKDREYLDAIGKEIEITRLANEYRAVIDGFHSWLQERQQELHSDSLNETEAIQERLSQVTQEWEREQEVKPQGE